MNLRQQTLDQLVDAKLLAKEARRIGFSASDEDVRQEIATSPTFHSFGAFSSDRYRRLLRYLRMTPQEFEEQQRDRLVIERFQKFMDGSIRATDYEVEELFRFEQDQVNLAFLKIASADLVDIVTISEQQVREFYTSNTESFRIPERVRLHYVSYTPEDFETEAAVSEEDVLDFYNTYKDERFTEEKQVQARHILFSIADSASDERRADTRSAAQMILERARAGEDFAALAKEYSQDTGTASSGGDLGFFGRGRMVKPFEEAAFGMDVGQVSDLVETPFGFHIIKVEAISLSISNRLKKSPIRLRKNYWNTKVVLLQRSGHEGSEENCRGHDAPPVCRIRWIGGRGNPACDSERDDSRSWSSSKTR